MRDLISQNLLHKAKNTFFYFGATLISFTVSIVTYPLFASYLSISEFAAFNYFTNYSGFFIFLFSINLYMFFSAHFFSNENEQSATLLKSLMSLLLVWNVLALPLAYLISNFVLHVWLKVKFDTGQYLLLSLAAVSMAGLKSIFLIKLRLRQQALQYFGVSVIARILGTLLGLYFIIYVRPTAESRFLGVLLAEIITTAIIYISVFYDGGFSIPVADLKRIFKFVWPLLLSSILYYPLISMDQIILERYVSREQLGLYSIGLGFAGYLHTFNFSVYQTLEPDIIRAKANSDLASLFANVKLLLLVAFITTTIFCFSSKHLIGILTNGKFTEAYRSANILAISFLFVLIFSVGNTLLTVENRGKTVFLVNFAGLFVITVSCALLAQFGSTGIAWARSVSFGILAALAISLSLTSWPKTK